MNHIARLLGSTSLGIAGGATLANGDQEIWPARGNCCYSLPYPFMRKRGDKPLMKPAPNEITQLLNDWSSGDQTALDRLMPLVYEELHQLAHQHMRHEPLSALYPLAYLGLARAAAMSRDVEKSRKAYEEFLRLWNDADAKLSALTEARKEYANVKQTLP